MQVLATDDSVMQALLRFTLAAVLLPHGTQHLLGWFGGYGFTGTLGWMSGTVGIPAPLAAAAIVFEFVGPLALAIGLGGRVVGLGLVTFMATAASTHLQNGFFMNWFGTLRAGTEGFEYHILAIALAAALAARGSGAYSIDRALTMGQRRNA